VAEHLLTRREVCARLRISETTLWRRTLLGDLPSIKIGSLVRYRQADVDAFIDRNTMPGPRRAEVGR